jgi:hypothetical protein
MVGGRWSIINDAKRGRIVFIMGHKKIEMNYIGFARYKLRLDPKETYVDPLNVLVGDLKADFEMTDRANADTIAIIGHLYGQIRVVHMAVRINKDTEKYEHRPRYCTKPRPVDDDDIQPDGCHSYSEFPEILLERKVYLKLKRKTE